MYHLQVGVGIIVAKWKTKRHVVTTTYRILKELPAQFINLDSSHWEEVSVQVAATTETGSEMEESDRPTTIVEFLSTNLQSITTRALQPSRAASILPVPIADKHLTPLVPEPPFANVLEQPVHSSPSTKELVNVPIVDETNHTDSANL